MLAALVHDHLDQGPGIPPRADVHDGHAVGPGRPALGDRDTLLGEAPEGAPPRLPLHLREIGPRHLVGGMGETVRQLAVVGEQQEALGGGIKPAHRQDALREPEQVEHGPASLGVLARRDHAGGLVERVVELARVERHPPALDLDRSGGGIDALPQHGGPAVDRHQASPDQVLGSPSGRYPGGRQQLLKPDALQGRTPGSTGRGRASGAVGPGGPPWSRPGLGRPGHAQIPGPRPDSIRSTSAVLGMKPASGGRSARLMSPSRSVKAPVVP